MTNSKIQKKMETDRLTRLPIEILFHIMSFLNIQDVVRTSVLSKQWKNLWKSVPNLRFDTDDFKHSGVSEFIRKIMSNRDENHSIQSLSFNPKAFFNPQLMTNFMSFVVSRKIKQLQICFPFDLALPFLPLCKELPSCVFSCQSLTSLSISASPYAKETAPKIPESLKLPSLLSLHLKHVRIAINENGHAEPFSNCKKLNTLHIDHCKLFNPYYPCFIVGSETLNITNATLANLIPHTTGQYKTVISTPNLSTFTLNGFPFQMLPKPIWEDDVEVLSSSLTKLNRAYLLNLLRRRR